MTLFDQLEEMNAPVIKKGHKTPREELRRVYPVVSEMFSEITKALNLGYSWRSIGAAVIAKMEAEGQKAQFIRVNDVAEIYRHIKKDMDLRGLQA
ncbi:MAG: hypothetical protein Q4C86_07525 [bacterium]|nr:hypothetical protein [bacterium]